MVCINSRNRFRHSCICTYPLLVCNNKVNIKRDLLYLCIFKFFINIQLAKLDLKLTGFQKPKNK